MAVLVCGGAGYIGSATVDALHQRAETVIVADNFSKGHRDALDPAIPVHSIDLSEGTRLARLIQENEVTEVIHFAAFTSVPESVAHPERYYRNNICNTLTLLEAMRLTGVSRIVFSSTAAVYGEPQYSPLDEDHPTVPTNPYGASKLFVEGMLDAFAAAHGLRYVALRYFNACGATATIGEDHDPETHLIPLVLQVALGQRESVKIFGTDYPTPDGSCVRDYIHIADLARAHLLALDHLRSGGENARLNLGNGQGYSVREVIDVARKITGHPIPAEEAPRRPGDPSTLVASAERSREILGWEPAIPELQAIVESAWAWHRAHPHGYEN